jgi:hypothetical protein
MVRPINVKMSRCRHCDKVYLINEVTSLYHYNGDCKLKFNEDNRRKWRLKNGANRKG